MDDKIKPIKKVKAEIIIKKKKYKIGIIYLDRDGNITNIKTIPDHNFGPFWEVDAKDFNKVKITISISSKN